MVEDMVQLHISEAELARDLHAVLEKVRQGAEVIVERNHQPLAVLRAATPQRRTISESIALAEQRDKQRGYAVTLDPEFAADIEQIVRNRKPWNPSSWD
jgi:antitoxin (DNA-binding transcriptional repressor) of toxin-antitoxin stability system